MSVYIFNKPSGPGEISVHFSTSYVSKSSEKYFA